MLKAERTKRVLRVVLLCLVVAGAIWFIREKWEWVAPIFGVGAFALCVMLASKLAVAVVNAWRFDLVVRMFGLRLPAVEWLGLSAVTVFYGRLLPFRLGAAARAYYLKTKYKFRYSEYVSLMAGAYALEALLSSWLGLGSSLARLPVTSSGETVLIALFAVAAAGVMIGSAAALYAAKRHISTGIQRLDKVIARLQASIAYYRRAGRLAYKSIAAAGVYILVQSFALGACFWALGSLPEPSVLLASTAAAGLSSVASVTPGNLGVREGAIIGTCAALGVPASVATPAALLSRATSLMLQIGLGLLFSYVLFGGFKPPKVPPEAD
jgi:uncharacterized protein (TIRG00374 family)